MSRHQRIKTSRQMTLDQARSADSTINSSSEFSKWTGTSGGELRKKARYRRYRPLSSKHSMHVVLRSSVAKGAWSFRYGKNAQLISRLLKKLSHRYGVRLISVANVGNHLHLHIKITNRTSYKAWIRGVTAGIVIQITRLNKLKKLQQKFWDYRPFTRVIHGVRAFLHMRDYMAINQFEGLGLHRLQALLLVKGSRYYFKTGWAEDTG